MGRGLKAYRWIGWVSYLLVSKLASLIRKRQQFNVEMFQPKMGSLLKQWAGGLKPVGGVAGGR